MNSVELERRLAEWWGALEDTFHATCMGRVELPKPIPVTPSPWWSDGDDEVVAVICSAASIEYQGKSGRLYDFEDLYAEDALLILKKVEEACSG